MTTAFLFPGQGAEIVRVAQPWLERSPAARRLIALAADQVALGVDQLLADGGRRLDRTEVQQPVLTALTLAVHEELARLGVRPDLVAGHSLGEVAACAAAGAMDHETAVAVAATRARLMAREAARHPGGMVALRTEKREIAEAALALAREHGMAALAAHNSPEQWVVAGDWPALRAAARRFPSTPVPVGGPWHTDAIAGAVAEFEAVLRQAIRAPLRTPLVCNRTGAPVRDAEALPRLLAGQLTQPVEWYATMRTLAEAGTTHLVVLGPGKTLRALARRGLAEAALHAAELPDDLDPIREALAR